MSFFSFATSRAKPTAPSLPGPQAVLDFWREAGSERWFAKDEAFDEDFRNRFLPSHEAAARGELMRWMGAAETALALLLLLDQFPRNCFRDTPRMYATDAQALQLTQKALSAGYDTLVDKTLRVFFYLPLMHDENLGSQFRCLALCAPLGGTARRSSQEHYAIIEQFGRFPHRNAILGRATTPEEQAFLAAGGFAG